MNQTNPFASDSNGGRCRRTEEVQTESFSRAHATVLTYALCDVDRQASNIASTCPECRTYSQHARESDSMSLDLLSSRGVSVMLQRNENWDSRLLGQECVRACLSGCMQLNNELMGAVSWYGHEFVSAVRRPREKRALYLLSVMPPLLVLDPSCCRVHASKVSSEQR